MLYLDPVGRHVTDPLELSRAAATRHAHVSALPQQGQKAPRALTRGYRRWVGGLTLNTSHHDSGRSRKVSATART
jgi:hypothetical protein